MSLEQNSLAQVISDALESRLADLHVCLPGQVQSYDKATGLANVQPCLQRKYQDGTVVNLPVVTNVPVCFPRSSGAFVHLPIAAGDYVTLVFSERSLDTWISGGGIVDPSDPRKHHLSDAFAIPGGYPQGSPVALPNGSDLVVGNGTAVMQLQKSGKFLFKGAGGQELMDVLDQLLTKILALQTIDPVTGFQPLSPPSIADFTAIQTLLRQLKGA